MDPVSFWATPIGWTLMTVGQVLLITVGVLVAVAFLLLADRKIWAGVQMRKGPNVVGPFGLLQSFADMIKFVLKEVVIPAGADKAVFIIAPIITVMLAFMAWAVIPFAPGWVISDLNVGILYILAVSSLGVYGIIMGGWASNSKYPFLGSLRSAAQMVSYEVSLGLIIINVILLAGTMNLSQIVLNQQGMFWNWYGFGGGADTWPLVVILFPMSIIFFISALAETNRPPFDLPEAESELVADEAVTDPADTPRLPPRRVVVAADVEDVTLRPDLDDAVVKIAGPVPVSAIASVHVDVAEAEPKVRAAVVVIDAADMGDLDAELAVGDVEDFDLAWYATQELPFLLELL